MSPDAAAPELSWAIPLLVALIPAVAGIAAAFVQRQAILPRPYRRLAHMVEALANTPEGSRSRVALDALVVALAEPLTKTLQTPKAKLNPYNLFWTIVFGVISGLIMFGLAQWVISSSGQLVAILAWIVTVVVGLGLS